MILSALIEERAGLHFPPEDADLLAAKIAPRMQELGVPSLLDYYYYVRYDDSSGRELEALIDAIVVNESYFFRELDPLRVLVDRFVVPITTERRARVWCAACASGEEPFTLAMLLASRGVLSSVDVLATDVSSTVLERARRGVLRARSLRDVPEPELAERYLHKEGLRVIVHARIREAVTFARVNLIDAAVVRALGPFDAILCRNVLIYFAAPVVRRIVEQLTQQLEVGGVLLVGVSESLMQCGGSIQCEEHEGSFFYRKVGA